MRRNARQDAINRLREQQANSPLRGKTFDERFDRHFENPTGFFVKFGLLAIVLNFIFWGGLLVLLFVLLAHFGVI